MLRLIHTKVVMQSFLRSIYKKCLFLTTPLGFSLVQRLSDFQSNKFMSRLSSAEEVHFVMNLEICSLFG